MALASLKQGSHASAGMSREFACTARFIPRLVLLTVLRALAYHLRAMTDEAAAELGRKRWKNVAPKERTEIGRLAAQTRWATYYAEHPEKLKTRRSGASRKKATTAKKKGKK